MDVVAHLFAFVAKNLVEAAFDVAFDEVTQKAVEFHAAVVRTGQTAAAQTAGFHAEIAPVFLHHHVARHFRGTKEGVFGLIIVKLSECRARKPDRRNPASLSSLSLILLGASPYTLLVLM